MRWLSRGKIQNRVSELQDELLFLKQKNLSIEKKLKVLFGVPN
jgi:hypothetical protein